MPRLPAEVPPEKMALVHLAGSAEWALSAERQSEANPLFNQLIASYPKEPGVHYLYGIYLLDRDPGEAMAEFREGLRISPSHVPARQQIAILQIKAGNSQPAIRLAREALALQPANALSHAILGRAFEHMGQYAEAVPELEAAVKLAPDNPQLHFSLGQLYRHVGRTNDAERETAEFNRLKSARSSVGVGN